MRVLSCLITFHLVKFLIGTPHSHPARRQRDPSYHFESWMDPTLPAPYATHSLRHHQHQHRGRHQHQERQLREAELAPLFPGYGTHYAYIYVGTPPQRQSVIIDTGSHYLAFPCTGCSQCGKHTDDYFNPKNSSTAVVPKCLNDQLCLISQSYTEGSSWHGYKIQDKVWMGGIKEDLLPGGESFAVKMEFGCQTTETGLFRSQLADGIMGFSHSSDTLPHQLLSQGITDSLIFALCFRVGGGMVTLGGVDQRIHTRTVQVGSGAVASSEISTQRSHGGLISYAALTIRAQGLYGVTITGIRLVSAKGVDHPVTASSPAVLNGGAKGVIVDSGTTDTYLPLAIKNAFMDAFRKATDGQLVYSGENVKLSASQLVLLPDIVFSFSQAPSTNNGTTAAPAESIEIRMPPASYLDVVGDGQYAYRVYLSERQGAVLGANFMNGYNVIFDAEGGRIGFAKSTCNYEEFAPVLSSAPTPSPTKAAGEEASGGSRPTECSSNTREFTPYTPCSARCDQNISAYLAHGEQNFIDQCDGTITRRPCTESCAYKHISRSPDSVAGACPDQPWSECTHACFMTRSVVPVGEPLFLHDGSKRCAYVTQTATCYAGLCPRQDGDYLVYVDMKVKINPLLWSYVYTESFYAAFNSLFKVSIVLYDIVRHAD